MRFLLKLVMKFVFMVAMVVVMAGVMRRSSSMFMQIPGAPEGAGPTEVPKFSSEETDLMGTVFKSALRLFSGQATRDQLSGELSDKLYAGRDTATMSELGIELVKPGSSPAPPDGGTAVAGTAPGAKAPAGGTTPAGATGANLPPGTKPANGQPGAQPATAQLRPKQAEKQSLLAAAAPGGHLPIPGVRTDLLGRIWDQTRRYSVELSMIPVVFLGMSLMNRLRRRRSQDDALMPPVTGFLPPAESEPFDMKHAVHALGTEEFELLVALIYQRQGYRVSMPAGLSGGRGGDFTLLRKAEKILVQCKKLDLDHRVPVERVRELQEAMTIAGASRGLYVASCGFTWDARNFAKANKVTVINARTLDELIIAARETPDEDLLDVSQWVPKLISKVQVTPPLCPACEAAMDQINASAGSVWVCSQRPDCRGRRIARKYQKPDPAAARKAEQSEDAVKPTDAPSQTNGASPTNGAGPASGVRPATAPAPASGARKISGITPVENITHADPARQAELTKLAEMARLAIEAKRAARVKQEEKEAAQARQAAQGSPSAPSSQARKVTPAAPPSQARPATPAAPGNRATPANPARPVTPATPGNRTTPTNPASQATPATPGNRTTPTNPARKAVPATPGNRGNS